MRLIPAQFVQFASLLEKQQGVSEGFLMTSSGTLEHEPAQTRTF